jgi:hypothetical protein
VFRDNYIHCNHPPSIAPHLPKLDVAGSNPVSRSNTSSKFNNLQSHPLGDNSLAQTPFRTFLAF